MRNCIKERRKARFRLAVLFSAAVLLCLILAGESAAFADDNLFGYTSSEVSAREISPDVKLIPGGMPFGIKLYTKGVPVVGLTEVNTGTKSERIAGDAGIRVGDVITGIDGTEVNTVSEVSKAVEASAGKPLVFTVERDGEKLDFTVAPKRSVDDGVYKAGLWIRDSTSGVGTVTYIDPADNSFAGLGHGINDVDTSLLLPMSRANVLEVRILGARKGKSGEPGELNGSFEPKLTGTLSANTPYGVFGRFDVMPDGAGKALPIALRDDVKTGECQIISTVGDTKEIYSARIVKKNRNDSMQKNFIIEVTDERLLDATGGIVRGMSGSPVIQDGRLVGAVTHVMINEPRRGYGIYIENMLKNSPDGENA